MQKLQIHNEIRSSELAALRRKKESKASQDKQARTNYLEKVTKEINLMDELESQIAEMEQKEAEILSRLQRTKSRHESAIKEYESELRNS